VAGLRERRHGADLGESATEAEDGVGDARVLVEAGGDRDGVGQREAAEARRQRRWVGGTVGGIEAFLQGAQRRLVGGFGVERKERRPRELHQGVQHQPSSGGRMWRPSGPTASGVLAMTASIGNGPYTWG